MTFDSMYLDFIPDRKRKASKPRYIKPASIKELERLHYADKQAKLPDIKTSYLPKTAFRDDSANGLTKCIVAWLPARILCRAGEYDRNVQS